jgi:hypothetical protein
LKYLKENFRKILGGTKKIYTSPSAPNTLIIRPREGDPLVTPERQKQFKMFLYIVKHSRPDFSNSVRELSKVADGATELHF